MSVDRINSQIAELERLKSQLPQGTPPAINQTFQIAPQGQGVMRFVNDINEVNKEFVIGDTPFFSKDMSILWVKNAKGSVKSYNLIEIVEKDEKDIQIEMLKAQIEELKNAKSSNSNDDEPVESSKSTDVSDDGHSNAK